jgi:predicted ArsR family transcriptional regulator
VLDALRTADTPLGVTDIADRLGVHPNTVRFHLDALVGEGRAEARTEAAKGRGRPRTVYAPLRGMDRGGTRGYRLLAQMLLSRFDADGDAAGEAATRAGRAWGRYLIDPLPPFREPTAMETTARLTALLDDLGFSPAADGSDDDAPPQRLRLRHCPFLELAEEYGHLVCPMHLGLMQGALAALDAPVTATRLEPFAEPEYCLAHLAPVPAAAR